MEDLLGLLLGRLDAVLGRAVGLGDALAPALLGLLAQLPRGALSRLDDARDSGWGVRSDLRCRRSPVCARGSRIGRAKMMGAMRPW